MYKKLILILIGILIISMALSGCSSSQNTGAVQTQNSSQQSTQAQSDGSLERVKKAGKIVIGVDDNFPPMEYRDDKGELIGFDVDLSKEIEKALGVKMEWMPTDWNGVILALNSKKFDMILSSMSMTEERAKSVNFTDPYLYGAQMIVVRGDNKDINGSKDLQGKIVGVQLGSTSEEAARKIEGIKEIKTYSQYPEAFADLTIGRTDAVVVDGMVGGYFLTKNPGNYRILDEELVKEPVGIAFRKEDVELRNAVNDVINELKANGKLKELSMKWFGVDMTN
ncbi:MAG: ABC transporter substrate-binding protein [Thermoanaerobacteraceae bacterium]|nr:ABC transporter substrate-binding protein [Thermoanaerobacteraceae bacterium]